MCAYANGTQKVFCSQADKCNPQECNPKTGSCDIKPVNCDDGNLCTTDSCAVVNGTSSCVNTPITCTQADKCIPVYCDSSSGKCKNGTALVCDDGNPCTTDRCDSATGSCVFTAVACNNTDHCNPQSCDRDTGNCVTSPVTCSDNNLCTSDSCDWKTGNCDFTTITCPTYDPCFPATCDALTGCGNTSFVDTCDDGNLCTVESCENIEGVATCVFSAVNCDDGNNCTVDSCSPTLGCVHTNLTCSDGNACTVDTCDVQLGCIHTDVVLPAYDKCTIGYCDEKLGIITTPVTCKPSSCKCNPKAGCDCSTSLIDNLSTTEKALGGTAIALIVIGVVAGIIFATLGGKKGYDYYKLRQEKLSAVVSNPLYETSGDGFRNPIYESQPE